MRRAGPLVSYKGGVMMTVTEDPDDAANRSLPQSKWPSGRRSRSSNRSVDLNSPVGRVPGGQSSTHLYKDGRIIPI